ncbi:flagellar glycosyl transferase FgtA [Pseudomonas straminea]|uniref:CDP-glycerol glycerophosphotransferase, TagB/SpsB family n=1 Tax=Pseudomonas straminea TaxID=47882 RepID=A0A1I1TG28_PSEOC|nr:flagellar glycosyl transferase FgtA [Pseudomonas straminea]SFD57571.1 CDP-glycerol glycerophosphotransferase, TagB/SpsB family [Pseudomonas straminea]
MAHKFWSNTDRGQIGPVALYQRQEEHLLEHVLPLLGENDHLLDIGCADGRFSRLFARKVARVSAMDLGAELIEQARALARAEGLDNVEFQAGNVFDFDTEDRFDAVSLMGVLTSISDDLAAARVLLKAVSLLKPGGLLILKDSVLLEGHEARQLLNEQYEAKYRPESRYLALIRSMGMYEIANYPLLTMDNYNQTSVLYLFRPLLSETRTSLPIKDLRVACFGSMPFHFRSLRPLSACFENSLLSLSIPEVMSWRPQVIVVADGWSVEFWRDYCDAHGVLLIGMRHGSVTRYGFAEPQYNHADYLCGSVWDIEDSLRSSVQPRSGFLLTGNAWVDEVFRLPSRPVNELAPTIVFAPTYNPEISAAAFFGERLVGLIREVYPTSRIIIKPHPAIVQHEHSFVVDKALFRGLMESWRAQVAADPLVELVDDPEASIADSFAEADILVADRSSLLFEFMALDRPILLYSSDARVGHWEYNPDAPGNAWRDIGMEFSDDEDFLDLLRCAYANHVQYCRDSQTRRVSELYGRFQDGRSVERVADAIARAPRPHVVIDTRETELDLEMLGAFERSMAFGHIAILGRQSAQNQLAQPQFENAQTLLDWLGRRQAQIQALMLVNGKAPYRPGSGHRISQGLAKLARGEHTAQVLTQQPVQGDASVPSSEPENWIIQRQRWAIEILQGTQLWTLLPGYGLRRGFAALPGRATEQVFNTWWQTLCVSGNSAPWPAQRIDTVFDDSVLRVVGRNHYLLAPRARLKLVCAVDGWPERDGSIQIDVSAVHGVEYDQFPFRAELRINGTVHRELTFRDYQAQRLVIPFRPEDGGSVTLDIHSSARFPGLAGLAGPLSLALGFVDAPVEQVSAAPPPVDTIKQWLAGRQPSAIERRLIRERLAEHNSGPRMAVVVMDPEGDIQALAKTLRSLNQEHHLYQPSTVAVVTAQTAPSDHGRTAVRMIQARPDELASKVNALAADLDVDWLMLVNAGDEFTASGLTVVALELLNAGECRALYCDELQRMPDGTLGAAFRPSFNLDLLLSLPSVMARNWLYRRDVFVESGGLNAQYPQAMEFELLTRLVEAGGMAGLGHVDEPLLITDAHVPVEIADEQAALLAHLNRRGYADAQLVTSAPGTYRIRYGHAGQPLVSILIPTKDQLAMVQRCVETLLEQTRYSNYEVLIIDNASETPEAQAWLAGIEALQEQKIRVLRYPHPFNFSAMNNFAALEAQGDYLVLLNNDTAIIREEWLDEMLNHAQRPEVGIVGAKLLYPDGRIQHAGVVLGLNGPADHPFIGEAIDAPGHMRRLQVDQNYSAVTAACLMIRRSIYLEVGGMDEQAFKVSYNDVDLCLKVGQAGYLNVWTPHALVLHEGNVSQKAIDPHKQEAKRKRFVAEQDIMYERWLPLLARDPAYNANLSLVQRGGFKLTDNAISWRPLQSWRPLPTLLVHQADMQGCGHYRMIQPFIAMKLQGLADGMLSRGLMHVPDLERYDPDSIVLQRQVGEDRIQAMQRMKSFSRAFKVYELDDYLPNLPVKNVHRSHMPKDILKTLRRGLGFVDRFVVSTDALAEAFGGLHDDIRVVKNRLPSHWWQGLESERRVSSRPRVGWAGGISHTGDLEMIADVVRELAGEVDWVFFGMCPENLKPYIREFHQGVHIDRYPAALARLNLDLAIAPVEQNLFNECKSNLRLLEYGACGFPVVCSDIRCYQDDAFPVTRVKNRYKDWVDAIRMHLADMDATARMGDELQQIVLRDWMLRGENLDAWARAWLPD